MHLRSYSLRCAYLLCYTPTAVTDVSHAVFIVSCVVTYFVCYFAVMCMVLVTGHEVVFVENGCPKLSAFCYHLKIVGTWGGVSARWVERIVVVGKFIMFGVGW